MKLHTAPQNQAILSNVGQIGEFRIRNSAKAFNILSSGLYANKIRAIIRELSCNAVDSHVAAGKQNTPFDVHLPSTLEPWFSIRDYGTGLNDDQVTNIYTTYFESTKTDSNDFVGALGLGSKSPFSYTDNFTVTAIQNKRKGIYTAFINEQGVPSIALMTETETNDPNGVEVKFAVNDRYDFDKFITEAKNVYKYFKLRPVIHGLSNFTFAEIRYKEKDVAPGIHTIDDYNSVAIMGNIAYPIDVPQADKSLGDLRQLLSCGLVIEFDIGELDFQASREGLSYIPSTIASIKNKLSELNDQLLVYITREAEKFKNLWERLDFLDRKGRHGLWHTAVVKYIDDTKLPIADTSCYGGMKPFKLDEVDLAKKYNITINGFSKNRGELKCHNLQTENDYDSVTQAYHRKWKINPSLSTYFVVSHKKRGPLEKTKNYFRRATQEDHSINVYLIQPADKTKPINTVKFFKDLYDPPKIFNADSFVDAENMVNNRNYKKASILRYEKRERGRYNTTYVWANQGTLEDYTDSNKTYYYIEMDHWNPVNLPENIDMDNFRRLINDSDLFDGQILGVRKRDIELVKKQKNWVELTQYVCDQLTKTSLDDVMGLVKEAIDFTSFFKYINNSINKNSPYYKMYVEFKDVKDTNSTVRYSMEKLLKAYKINVNNQDPNSLIKTYKSKIKELNERYPLLKHISSYGINIDEVVAYINMVDQVKGT